MELRSALPTSILLGVAVGLSAAALGSARPGLDLFSGTLDTETHVASGSSARAADDAVSWDIPIILNEPVQRFVRLFEERQSDRMALYLKRSGRYEGMIREKLRERGMPEDLLYLSMIESGFNPTARSKAQAVGLWQFIAETGRNYGLRIDSYVDERRDPEKSTDAALRYLGDLYDRFGSWNLAAAAYNSGENRVGRIMREETGAERGREEDFWRIRGRLPRETRDYVPLIVAAALIGKEPQKYGLEHVERYMPAPTETVAVPGGTDLEVVAKAVGASEDELRTLNPQLLRSMTPPGTSAYGVRIPEGRLLQYAANFERMRGEYQARAEARRAEEKRLAQAAAKKAAAKKAAARTYKVRRGESLSVIAKRHGVSVASLQRANGLGKRTTIHAGQSLRIPR
jgi:membrane-bound lytic murein transglycosylase D